MYKCQFTVLENKNWNSKVFFQIILGLNQAWIGAWKFTALYSSIFKKKKSCQDVMCLLWNFVWSCRMKLLNNLVDSDVKQPSVCAPPLMWAASVGVFVCVCETWTLPLRLLSAIVKISAIHFKAFVKLLDVLFFYPLEPLDAAGVVSLCVPSNIYFCKMTGHSHFPNVSSIIITSSLFKVSK